MESRLSNTSTGSELSSSDGSPGLQQPRDVSSWSSATPQRSISFKGDRSVGRNARAAIPASSSRAEVDKEAGTPVAPPGIECVVCGDKSSGKHYGQVTCEGCKSFFKRSVRRNLVYTCRGNRNCPVDQHHRNQCQDCRLRKCLQSGMKREAVQRGRASSLQPRRLSGHLQLLTRGDHYGDQSGYLTAGFLSSLQVRHNRSATLPVYLHPYHQPSILCGFDGIFELAARMLFAAIDWVRQVPDLRPPDRLGLVRLSWSELFVLTAAQGSMPVDALPILTSAGIQAGPSEAGLVLRTLDNFRFLNEQMDRLKALHIDAVEFSCLKAIVLFSSEPATTSDVAVPPYIDALQEKCLNALCDYVRLQHPEDPSRFGRLLLRLPPLRSIAPQTIEQLFFPRLIAKKSIDGIIRDILVQQQQQPANGTLTPSDPFFGHCILCLPRGCF